MTLQPSSIEAPEPDTARPWRIIVKHAHNDHSPNLVAVVDFTYHGLKVRGVRVFRVERERDVDTPSGVKRQMVSEYLVNMPQKKFGDAIENCVYFLDNAERDLFRADVAAMVERRMGQRVGVSADVE